MSRYRNRYFLTGILLLLLGAQFRMIDSFVLNETSTRLLAKVTRSAPVADNSRMGSFFWNHAPKAMTTKRIHPPRWLGLAMMAMGSIISFHALAIPRFRE